MENSDIKSNASRWAVAVCALFVGISFLMFVFSLNRNPSFFVDEPWFNNSAVRCVDGKSFAYSLDSRAPHGDTVLSPHGPFFFRMQIATFKLLGPSHFACRIPSFLGAHVAVLALCLYLIRRRYWKSAIGVAVLWLGDRSTQYLLLGRPEGVSFAFAVLGYICLIEGLRTRRLGWYFAVAGSIGISAGFNPAGAFFGIASFVCMLLMLPFRDVSKSIPVMAAGLIIPVALVLLCWLPDIPACFEQNVWWHRFNTTGLLGLSLSRVALILSGLGYSLMLHVYLLILVIIIGWLVLRRIITCRKASRQMEEGETFALAAVFFALAGIAIYVFSSRFAYYLVYFTIWPSLALLVWWEKCENDRDSRIIILRFLVALVFIGWLPSLFWNGMRGREGLLWNRVLNKANLEATWSNNIPRGAEVMGDPIYFIAARNAGLNFTPLSWDESDPGITAPSGAWLIISPSYLDRLKDHNPAVLEQRTLIHRGVAFPGSTYTEHPYFIYGPKRK